MAAFENCCENENSLFSLPSGIRKELVVLHGRKEDSGYKFSESSAPEQTAWEICEFTESQNGRVWKGPLWVI